MAAAMNRRELFKSLCAVTLAASLPLKFIAPPLYRRIESSLFSELVTTTLRRHSAHIARAIEQENAALKYLMSRSPDPLRVHMDWDMSGLDEKPLA